MSRWLMVILCVCLLALPVSQAWAKKEWEGLKGGNFIIYYRDAPMDFVQTVMESAEENFRRVTENLGITRIRSWAWERRASIYIYRDEKDYIENGGQAGWSHGAALVREKAIRTYPAAHGFFDSILPHELAHIIFREYVGLDIWIPSWFEEGVAMNQEKAKRLGSDAAVQEAIKNGQFIPLSRLTDMQLYRDSDQQTVELFYAEAASVVHYLIAQQGDQRFFRFCRALKEQVPFKDALAQVYVRAKTLDDLNKLWISDLKE